MLPSPRLRGRLRRREFQRHVQRIHELVDLDRLGEIAEESGLQAFLDVARDRVGAERDHRDVRRGRVFGEDPQRLDAADARQIDVHQDHVRQGGARHLDAADAVPRAEQADVGPARDEVLDQHQVGRIVLDVEQGAHLRIGLPLRLGESRGFVGAGGRLRFGRQVQLDPEHASLPDRAFHADDAPHQFDQPLAHDQADAGAFLVFASCPRRLNGWNSCASCSGDKPVAGVRTLMRMRVRRADACSRRPPFRRSCCT